MSSQEQERDGASGVINPFAGASDYTTQAFLIQQALSSVRTTTLVQVIDCTNDGGLSQVGFVDLKVLVQRMDGAGNAIDAGVIYNVPYFRLQGGENAIIMDPQPGDIGLANIADRDISAVVASKAQATPGSDRRHSMADALYIGGILNGTPTQYVQFSSSGIKLVSPTMITLQAPEIDLDGVVKASKTITAIGDVVGAGISLSTHRTQGVTPGSGTSGLPI